MLLSVLMLFAIARIAVSWGYSGDGPGAAEELPLAPEGKP